MKCPYRKKETLSWHRMRDNVASTKEEEFADCYGTDCPLYKPEMQIGSFTVSANCNRALNEQTRTDLQVIDIADIGKED